MFGPWLKGAPHLSRCVAHASQDAEKVLRRAWPCATGACMLLICNGGAGPCPANIEVRQTFSSSRSACTGELQFAVSSATASPQPIPPPAHAGRATIGPPHDDFRKRT